MKPSFQIVMQNYPRATLRQALFADVGWNDLAENPAYYDTCAIRVSYALLNAGVILPGARMQAKAGALNGKWIEPGQAKLSNILKRLWGAPEVFKSEAGARAGIGQRKGVISFFRINGADGGHIDLVWMGVNGFSECARSCYFTAVTIWFWPLP